MSDYGRRSRRTWTIAFSVLFAGIIVYTWTYPGGAFWWGYGLIMASLVLIFVGGRQRAQDRKAAIEAAQRRERSRR